jgi:hypothetical protein
MVKIHYVKHANEDNSAVTAGNPYFWWKLDGVKYYSATMPTQDQLTSDTFILSIQTINDALAGADFSSYVTAVGFVDGQITAVTALKTQEETNLDDLSSFPKDAMEAYRISVRIVDLEDMLVRLEEDTDFDELNYAEQNLAEEPTDATLIALYQAELQEALNTVRSIQYEGR